MLPDFTTLKQRLNARLMTQMRKVKEEHLSPVGTWFPSFNIVEGHRWMLVRSDGTEDEIDFKKAESILQLDLKEVETMSAESVAARYAGLVRDLAGQQLKHIFAVIDETVDATGNKIDSGGKPLTAEVLLAALEKIEWGFEADGTPHMPALMVNPKMCDAITRVDAELRENPDYQRRFEEIIRRKREEWRASEADRKLVG